MKLGLWASVFGLIAVKLFALLNCYVVLVAFVSSTDFDVKLFRFWLQNWIGPSLPGSSFNVHW